jgi:hypothetical protein
MLVNCDRERGVSHETRRTAARGLGWNGGSDAGRHTNADALSCYFSHERRWQLEVLYHCWNSKSVLSISGGDTSRVVLRAQ